jgi:hypothetical protein
VYVRAAPAAAPRRVLTTVPLLMPVDSWRDEAAAGSYEGNVVVVVVVVTLRRSMV